MKTLFETLSPLIKHLFKSFVHFFHWTYVFIIQFQKLFILHTSLLPVWCSANIFSHTVVYLFIHLTVTSFYYWYFILFTDCTHPQKGDVYKTKDQWRSVLEFFYHNTAYLFQSLNLFVSLYSKWASYRQYIIGLLLLNPISQSLPLIGLFIFNVIIQRAEFKSIILLFALYLFHLFFVPFFHLKKF